METVSSTYNSSTAAVYPLQPRQSGTDKTVADQATPRAKAPVPDNSDPQKGFQPSDSTAAEFVPYSPLGNSTQDPQVQAEIARLKSTEEKVKAHEAAHKSAGGTMTGPVSYTYTRGPDGRNYISGGEVPISISSGNTPQETISRMQQVIQAALAPADPSPQDRAVAAQAAALQQQARQEAASTTPPQDKPAPAGTRNNELAAAYSALQPETLSASSRTAGTESRPVSYYA